MSRLLYLSVAALLFSSCELKKDADSSLLGVRRGNGKLVKCKWAHPHLGGKRVEHIAVYNARLAKLVPQSLEAPEKMTWKERDAAFQTKLLEPIRYKDPLYYGLITDKLARFDRGESVSFKYLNEFESSKDPNEDVSYPSTGFLVTDGQDAYNPRYHKQPCESLTSIVRTTRSVGQHTYQVARDHWHQDMDPAAKEVPAGFTPVDPKMDYLDYRGRVTAKIEEMIDGFELAHENDVIDYVTHLVSGTFADMSFTDYRLWKENNRLSTRYHMDKRSHYYGGLDMEGLTFHDDAKTVRSGTIQTDKATQYDISGFDFYVNHGQDEYSFDYNYGEVEFAENGNVDSIWGHVRFSNRRSMYPKNNCMLHFDEKAHGRLVLKNKQLIKIDDFTGALFIGCVESKKMGFVRIKKAQFDGEGQLTRLTLGGAGYNFVEGEETRRYRVELRLADGSYQSFVSGDTLEIVNRRVKGKLSK